MFDKLNQLKELKEILEKEKGEVEKEGIKVTINGKMEIEEIKLNSDLDLKKQESILKECFNEAMKKIQTKAVQKMFLK